MDADFKAEWDKLKATIARQPTVSSGVILYLNTVLERLRGWEKIPAGPTAAEVKAEREKLEAVEDELAAAIVVNTDAEKTDPLTVPAKVQGQPGTTYPDGVERQPFPTDGFPRDVDMSAPQPSPGINPVSGNSEPRGEQMEGER
jgi:hypothetical protein